MKPWKARAEEKRTIMFVHLPPQTCYFFNVSFSNGTSSNLANNGHRIPFHTVGADMKTANLVYIDDANDTLKCWTSLVGNYPNDSLVQLK